MTTSQTVRFAPTNLLNFNNPTNLTLDVKPSRILVAAGAPAPTTGSLLDYYIDSATGNFYFKDASGVWNLIYNFSVAPGTGITDLNNLGTGAQIYVPPIIGDIADLRSLVSSTGKITFVQEPNDINFGVNLNKSDVQLPLVQNILNNYTAGSDPTVNNDSLQNYSIGSLWWNESTGNLFIAQSVAVGAAVWIHINIAASGFLTNGNNLGLIGPFANVTGTIANFRGFISSDNSIAIAQAGNNINFGVSPSNVPGIFKDLSSWGFIGPATTPLTVSNTVFPLQAPWIVSPSLFLRPVVSGWGVTGSTPFFNITRLAPTSSLAGTNYYLVTYSFIVSVTGALGTPLISLNWNSTGNCQVGNSVSQVSIAPTGLVRDTLAGSFLVASFDNAAFSLFVEIQSSIAVVAVTVQYAACTITQI